jgi:uncharacterized coiled-coil DUF342 family protein
MVIATLFYWWTADKTTSNRDYEGMTQKILPDTYLSSIEHSARKNRTKKLEDEVDVLLWGIKNTSKKQLGKVKEDMDILSKKADEMKSLAQQLQLKSQPPQSEEIDEFGVKLSFLFQELRKIQKRIKEKEIEKESPAAQDPRT